MSNLLFKLEDLIEGTVAKRPSKYIKSPYVADVIIENESVLAHSASLGCCGLADVGPQKENRYSKPSCTKTHSRTDLNKKRN